MQASSVVDIPCILLVRGAQFADNSGRIVQNAVRQEARV